MSHNKGCDCQACLRAKIEALQAEIDRMRQSLEWYGTEAKALAKNVAGGVHTDGVLASVTVLALDAGRRADASLGPTTSLTSQNSLWSEGMFRLRSLGSVEIKGRGTAYMVRSPVSAARTFEAMRAAMGPQVEIDGVVHEQIGFEMKMPGSPVRVGEEISILVR